MVRSCVVGGRTVIVPRGRWRTGQLQLPAFPLAEHLVTSDRPVTAEMISPKGRARSLVVSALFALVGLVVAGDAAGDLATGWMNIYAVSDFATTASVGDFVSNLLVPIPIVLSLTEIATYKMFGSTYLITHILYRFSLVFSYVLAIQLFSKNRSGLLLSAFVSFVFLWCTLLIHPGNPENYDVLFAFFNLLFVASLAAVPELDGHSRTAVKSAMLCLLAGFSLSMFELLRPFVFYLFPVLLLCTFQKLKSLPIRYFLYFLLPVVLLSGSWHGYLAARHGQISWSNHTGFNLIRAWPMVDLPPLVPESNDQRLAPDRLENLNTREHLENSRRLQARIFEFIMTHPRTSLENVAHRLYVFLKVPTDLHINNPPYPELWLYRVLVWLGCLVVVRNLVLLGYRTLSSRRLDRFGDPENILSCMAFLYIVLMAVGEAGEESRFWISVLPLLAALVPRIDVHQDGWRVQKAFGMVQQRWKTIAQRRVRS